MSIMIEVAYSNIAKIKFTCVKQQHIKSQFNIDSYVSMDEILDNDFLEYGGILLEGDEITPIGFFVPLNMVYLTV